MIHRWKDVNLSRVTGNCIVCDIIWIEMGEELSCWPIATKSSSKTPLTTELSFDDNDHEKEKERERDLPGSGEKSGIAWNGRTRGKNAGAQGGEKPRSSESNSLRIEKETVREADPVFHSPGRSCGRFPRWRRNLWRTVYLENKRAGGEMEIEGNSKLANSTEEILFIPRSWWLCLLRVEKTTEFFFSNDRKLKSRSC